jgi:hypothetical protein
LRKVPCDTIDRAGAFLARTIPGFGLKFPVLALRLWELRMSGTGWTPSIVPMVVVPYGADQTVYLVVDSFGRLGTAYRETDIKRTDLETVITDLMSGQFNDPVRIVAFNTLEHWAQDVSRDVALEIQSRCDIDGHDVPETLRDFVDSHAGPDRQLALRYHDQSSRRAIPQISSGRAGQ